MDDKQWVMLAATRRGLLAWIQCELMSVPLRQEWCTGNVKTSSVIWLLDCGYNVDDLVFEEQLALLKRSTEPEENQNLGAGYMNYSNTYCF